MDLYLNYQEVAFVMNCKAAEAKLLFSRLLKTDKVKVSDELHISNFKGEFGTIYSIDKRYEGLCKFTFYLGQCKQSYRAYLNDTDAIRKMKFTGGKAIFYKILDKEKIKIIEDNLRYKNIQIYNFK